MSYEPRKQMRYHNYKLMIRLRGFLSCIYKPTFTFCTASVADNPHLYNEQGYTPKRFTQMLLSQLRTPVENHKQILFKLLHQMELFNNKIIPFNYDYYSHASVYLSMSQKQLKVDQIMLVMRLGMEHRMQHESAWKLFQNQLHHRLCTEWLPYVNAYHEQIEQQFAEMLTSFQKNNKDPFNILTEEQIQRQQLQEQAKLVQKVEMEDEKQQKAITKSISKQKVVHKPGKHISFDLLIEISSMLIWSNSLNLPLLNLLMETITIQLTKPEYQKPNYVLAHLRLLNHLCAVYMSTYTKDKQKYTSRSIKNIYKFQSHYYAEHFLYMAEAVKLFQDRHIQELVSVYAAFPIKRRSIRRNIGTIIAEESKKRNLTNKQELLRTMISMNKNDPKMTKFYCQVLGLPQIQPEVMLQSEQVNEHKEDVEIEILSQSQQQSSN